MIETLPPSGPGTPRCRLWQGRGRPGTACVTLSRPVRGLREGRRRARRDVHDPDDDRRPGRPQSQRGARVLAAAARATERTSGRLAQYGIRDVALALAAGASNVMIGSWFAGTLESPGDAAATRTAVRLREFRHGVGPRGQAPDGHRVLSTGPARRCSRRASRPRGCSSTRPRPGVEDLLDAITAGVRSAFTYAGARNLAEFHERARRRGAERGRLRRGDAAGDKLVTESVLRARQALPGRRCPAGGCFGGGRVPPGRR